MTTRAVFRFHPVGQGLFYSGIISRDTHKSFSFVYDCGSESDRTFLFREIDDFKRLLPTSSVASKKKINLLVVSHFHDDHVNGMEHLFENATVDTVVIPYMGDDLRLLARLESTRTELFLESFYLDPIGWFSARGVRRVVVVGSDEENRIDDGERLTQSLNTEDRYQRSDAEDDEFIIRGENRPLSSDIEGTEVLSFPNGLTGSIAYWQFEFENMKLPKVSDYKRVVEDYLRTNMLTITDVMHSRSLTNALAREIKGILKNGRSVNQTSVMLKHGPMNYVRSDIFFLNGHDRDGLLDIDDYYFMYHHMPSTVLTGDIDISSADAPHVLKGAPIVLQYPHHGANNKGGRFLSDLRARYYVFSFGISNKYGHPSYGSLQHEEHEKRNVFVNERSSFDYSIVI